MFNSEYGEYQDLRESLLDESTIERGATANLNTNEGFGAKSIVFCSATIKSVDSFFSKLYRKFHENATAFHAMQVIILISCFFTVMFLPLLHSDTTIFYWNCTKDTSEELVIHRSLYSVLLLEASLAHVASYYEANVFWEQYLRVPYIIMHILFRIYSTIVSFSNLTRSTTAGDHFNNGHFLILYIIISWIFSIVRFMNAFHMRKYYLDFFGIRRQPSFDLNQVDQH